MLITTRCQHNDIEVAKWPRSSHVRDIRVCCHVAMPNDSRYTTRLVRSSSVNQIPSYRTSTAPRNVNDMTHVLFPHTKHRPSVRTTHAIRTLLSRQGWVGGGGGGVWGWGGWWGGGGGGIAHTALFISIRKKKKALRSRSARDRLSHLQVAHNHDEGRPRSRRAAALLVALA